MLSILELLENQPILHGDHYTLFARMEMLVENEWRYVRLHGDLDTGIMVLLIIIDNRRYMITRVIQPHEEKWVVNKSSCTTVTNANFFRARRDEIWLAIIDELLEWMPWFCGNFGTNDFKVFLRLTTSFFPKIGSIYHIPIAKVNSIYQQKK